MSQEESQPEKTQPATGAALPLLLQGLLSRFRPRTRKQYLVLGLILLIALFGSIQCRWTATYSAQVVVLPAPVDNEISIGLNPTTERLDFGDLPQGLTQSRFVTLENGRIPTRVTIVIYGGIRDFISVDDAFFIMDPNETRRVQFDIAPPFNAEIKKHTGRVVIVRTPWLPWP